MRIALHAWRSSGQSKRATPRNLLGVLSIAAFILIWTLVALLVDSSYLPTPLKVFIALARSFVEKDYLGFSISEHILASLLRILNGFLLAVVIGVPLGLLSGWSRSLEDFTGPVVDLLRHVPPLAWMPFAIYLFREPFDAVFVVFIAIVFPILLNTVTGVKTIDPTIIDAARTLGARGHVLFLKVVIPAAVRSIVTGIRIGLGVGWMSIVAAEMVGVKGGGLGFYIWSMAEIGRFDHVFAGMVLIGMIGLLMTKSMSYLEHGLWKGWITS